jgi:hypothetical protein
MPLTRALGLTLARDLPPTGPNRIPLLRRGTILTPRFSAALLVHRIHAVWVDDKLSEGIDPVDLLPRAVRIETAAKVASALDQARAAIGDSQRLAHTVLAELHGVVDLIAANINDSPDAALVLSDLAAADQYTHLQSVNVTALGVDRTRLLAHGGVGGLPRPAARPAQSRPSAEPLAQLGVDLRVVEEREVVCAADAQAVLLLERDAPRAAASRGARRQHEPVADEPRDRMIRVACQRCGDKVVRGALEQGHLLARRRPQRIGIAALPVAIDEGALAQVADAGAAATQQAGERSRLRHRV